VRRLIWLIGGSRLLIAPDTGPVHIARALDVPVIGLYGHTNPWRVGPYRRFEELWVDTYTEPGSAPDPSNRTPRLGRMERISVDDVLARVSHALEHHAAAPSPGGSGSGDAVSSSTGPSPGLSAQSGVRDGSGPASGGSGHGS
jgi:heptosyltransferase I